MENSLGVILLMTVNDPGIGNKVRNLGRSSIGEIFIDGRELTAGCDGLIDEMVALDGRTSVFIEAAWSNQRFK